MQGMPLQRSPYALGFHFFSHFLWLWWLPLASYMVETVRAGRFGKLLKWIFAGCAMFGAFAGTLVYSVMVSHPEWMTVGVRIALHHLRFFRSLAQPDPPADHAGRAVCADHPGAAAVLQPHANQDLRRAGCHVQCAGFGIFGYAYVSVWCFFAAALSLYLVFMIRRMVAAAQDGDTVSARNEG